MARRIRWQIVTAAISALLIAALLGALALRTAVDAGPTQGGTYIEGVVGTVPERVNPLLDDPEANPAGADISALVFQGLMRIGDNGEPALDLAQEATVDDGGTVYTFTLPLDARWQDGQPLTARDVAFTVGAVKGGGLVGDAAQQSLWAGVAVDVVDEQTVRFTLPAPFAPFLSAARLPIVPQHLFGAVPPAQWPTAAFSRQPVGSGPFRLERLGPDGAALVAYPGYRSARPKNSSGAPLLLDHIELRFFPSADQAIAALGRGEISGVAFDSAQAARIAAPVGAKTARLPLDAYTTISLNTRSAPLSDVGLRRALARALDKDALVAAVGGVARLDAPILPGSWAADASAQAPPADPATAARLLGELGYAPGADGVLARGATRLSLPLVTDAAPDHVAAAAEVVRQLAALGIEVKVEQLDGAALRARLHSHAFVLALHSFSRLGPDPDPFELWDSSQAESGLNYPGVADDQLDTLLESARSEPDQSYRSDDYAAFVARWQELAPAIPLYQPTLTLALAPQVGGTGLVDGQGVAPLLFGRADRFRDITRWYVSSSRVIGGDLRRP